MATLSSFVSDYGDLNARIGFTLLLTNLCNEPINQDMIKQVMDFIRADELEPALTEFFVSRNETSLQATYAKNIVEELLSLWLPTNRSVFDNLSTLQDQKQSIQNIKSSLRDHNLDIRDLITDSETGTPIPINKYLDENITILNGWAQMLEHLNRRIIDLIRKFVPSLYTQYRGKFRKYISIRENEIILASQEVQPKETVGENEQLKSKSRFDLTQSSNLPKFDFIVDKAKILTRSARNSSLGMNFSIYEDLIKYTDYFLIENRNNWDSDHDELNDELNKWFIQQSDSKVQDRFANSLITDLFQLFGPLGRDLDNIVDYSQDTSHNKSQEYINENREFCDTIRYTVQNWLFCIRKNILHFAPERYAESKVLLTQLVPLFKIYDEEYDYVPPSQLHQPGVKLQWNGAADTLYDVFRQLKNHHLPNGSALVEDSYDKIVLFIQQSFAGFDSVATSTIRGKLTKNNRPKKSFNRIDLDFTEPD